MALEINSRWEAQIVYFLEAVSSVINLDFYFRDGTDYRHLWKLEISSKSKLEWNLYLSLGTRVSKTVLNVDFLTHWSQSSDQLRLKPLADKFNEFREEKQLQLRSIGYINIFSRISRLIWYRSLDILSQMSFVQCVSKATEWMNGDSLTHF